MNPRRRPEAGGADARPSEGGEQARDSDYEALELRHVPGVQLDLRGGHVLAQMRERAGAGIGRIAGEWCNSQAIAICDGVAP